MNNNIENAADANGAEERAAAQDEARIALGPPPVRPARQQAVRDARFLRQLDRMNVNDETAARRLVFPPGAE